MGQTFMKEKKILPLVLSMSLPMMLSMLVNSLYNIVDSYFVAQISEQAMTALSLVYPLHLSLYFIFLTALFPKENRYATKKIDKKTNRIKILMA